MTERRTPTGRLHRRGRARTQVLAALEHAGRPMSAEDVAALVPDVHVSSVYRALATLEEEGVVAHLHLGHGPSIYRLTAEATSDGHVVCEVCGRHEVVPEVVFAPLADALRAAHGFVLDTSHFAVVGRCEGCLAAETRQTAAPVAPHRH
jgi:Fur family ferric uptake transcriptional regulator